MDDKQQNVDDGIVDTGPAPNTPKTIQIAPDALANVAIRRKIVDADGNVTGREPVSEFQVSRNVTMGLLPKLKEVTESMQLAALEVTISLSGKDPKTGNELQMPIYDGDLISVIKMLESRVVTNDEAMMASTSFFQDMFDMIDLKAVMLVAVFAKGQASYVLTNRTVDVDNTHMLRLLATAAMQMDKLKDHMAANGLQVPEAGKIVTPGDAGFRVPPRV